jgi:sugar/nucleoside kinase (ribokinase family)
MEAAARHGTVISYDLNYRPSLWKSIGGQKRAQEVNRQLAPLVDVMLGNEEDFTPPSASRWRGWTRTSPASIPRTSAR